MNTVKLYFYIEALVCVVTGIKVNMQGSFSFGRDVVESLSHYLGKTLLSGRRSFNPPPDEDPITLAVRTALICKDLKICRIELQNFLNEYIIVLAKAQSTILTNSGSDISTKTQEQQLKRRLEDIKMTLQDTNVKVDNDTEAYYWTHIIKRINSRFQNIDDSLDYKANDTAQLIGNKLETDMLHKIIIATAFIERKYQTKLCTEHSLCSESYHCTRDLNKLLIHFKTMSEDRIRMFIKCFYEALFDTPFYSHLSQTTGNEFQLILNDMIYSNVTPTKEIMLSVLKTVEARIEMIQSNNMLVVAHDILIAHNILSDLDHMFSNRSNAFTMFLNKFYDWLASDVHVDKHIRSVLADITTQISSFEDDLVQKLKNEVTVFLGMAVNMSENK